MLIINSFIFQLSKDEFESLRSQIVTFKESTRRRKYSPYVFTEHGVAMLSAILSSEKAFEVSIRIVEEFIKLRTLLKSDESLSNRIEKLEKGSNNMFRIVFERLDNLEADLPILPNKRRKIGLSDKD